jgi:hypothetical protein
MLTLVLAFFDAIIFLSSTPDAGQNSDAGIAIELTVAFFWVIAPDSNDSLYLLRYAFSCSASTCQRSL